MAERRTVHDVGSRRRVPSHWRWRPDWTPGRTALWWYLTFDDHPLVAETGRVLAEAMRSETALDLNPGPWLHVTLRELGYLDEVAPGTLAESVSTTTRALRELDPVALRTAGTGTLPGAVVRWVEPRSQVERLRAAVVGVELPPTAAADEVAPEVVRPHLSIAYARHDLDPTDLLERLPRPVEVSLPVSHVVLAAVTRREHHYEWRVRERVPLGRGHGSSAPGH